MPDLVGVKLRSRRRASVFSPMKSRGLAGWRRELRGLSSVRPVTVRAADITAHVDFLKGDGPPYRLSM
jgi:hypothetical protein